MFDEEHFEGVTEDCQEDSLTFDDIDFFPTDQLDVKATKEESNTPTHEEQPTTPTASSPTAHYGESETNIEEPGCTPTPILRRSTRIRYAPRRLLEFANVTKITEASTYQETKDCPHWQAAMQSEFGSIIRNKTCMGAS